MNNIAMLNRDPSAQRLTFFGETPWGNTGKPLSQDHSIEEQAQAAGFDFEIHRAPALAYDSHTDEMIEFPNKHMLYRSDNQMPLSIVSDKYEIVQPQEVLGFFKQASDQFGFKLNTAGVLHGGRKFWALAEMPQSFVINGQDKVHQFLNMATSCDGGLASTFNPTNIRPFCNNMWNQIMRDGKIDSIKIRHNQSINFDQVLEDLQLGNFTETAEVCGEMAQRKISDKEAVEFLIRVISGVDEVDEDNIENARTVQSAFELFKGAGMGSHCVSADGTLWGAFNAVTEHVDHHRKTKAVDNRFDSATFGSGAKTKNRAYTEALKLVA